VPPSVAAETLVMLAKTPPVEAPGVVPPPKVVAPGPPAPAPMQTMVFVDDQSLGTVHEVVPVRILMTLSVADAGTLKQQNARARRRRITAEPL
jgi:hypothetical protein